MAIPGDHGVVKKETEKITDYSELRTEVGRMWRVKVKVIPIIVGALGMVPRKLLYFLNQLNINYDIGTFCVSSTRSEVSDLMERK